MTAEKNRACPACRENGHDADGDHLYLMRDGNRWACFKSDYHASGTPYFEDVNGKAVEESGESEHSLEQLISSFSGGSTNSFPVTTDAGTRSLETLRKVYRGIEPRVYTKYGVQASYAGQDIQTLEHELYETGTGHIVARKIRKIPKDFLLSNKTNGRSIQLFGQSVFKSAKRVLITEGELDAMSAYQMLEKYRVACISLPTGANTKSILDNMDYIRQFTKGNREIYIATDMDGPGQTTAKDIANILPDAKFLKMDLKDPNEYLKAGRESDFVSAFWSAEKWKPESIVRVSSIIKDVMKRPVMGRPWPWESLTNATYGRRDGEGIYVGAGVKIGKSEFINELIAFDCQNGWPISAIKYEEPPAVTVKRVAGKIDGIFYHRPGVVYNDKDLQARALALDPHLYLHQAFGTADWDSTKEYIRYVVSMGVKTVIIDPVTKLTNHLDPSATETELRRLSDEIACMAHDMGFFYIITCHLKAPSTGQPHERGGKVQSYQFRGSRAMMENTYYMLGIERNKDPDLPERDRNTSTFVLLEDRNFGNATKFPVYYDTTNQSYLEPSISGAF